MSGPGYDHGPGLCIVMSNELDEDAFLEPCSGKPKADGHGQYGLCQAGTSLAVSDVSVAPLSTCTSADGWNVVLLSVWRL